MASDVELRPFEEGPRRSSFSGDGTLAGKAMEPIGEGAWMWIARAEGTPRVRFAHAARRSVNRHEVAGNPGDLFSGRLAVRGILFARFLPCSRTRLLS